MRAGVRVTGRMPPPVAVVVVFMAAATRGVVIAMVVGVVPAHRCSRRSSWSALDGLVVVPVLVPGYVLMYARDNAATASDPQELPSGAQVEAAVTALRMLADPTRLRLMWLLSAGEYDVGSLAAALRVARPAVSQHLGKLRLAGLVTARREGRRALYAARGGHVRRLVAEVVHAADHQVSGAPNHD
jgi:DNA-binding transcriptional ArsR family regulator